MAFSLPSLVERGYMYAQAYFARSESMKGEVEEFCSHT